MAIMTVSAASSLRERIVAAATELTVASGWASVTMARLAEAVGVSRQTIYNEVGDKAGLAEAMILGELARFLDAVNSAFDREPTDLVAAIRRAVRDVLEMSLGNDLLKAVVSASHGADTELLPLLTTHSEALVETAKAVVSERLAPFSVALTPIELEGAIDIIVRVVLSHVMQPSGTPDQTADALAFFSRRVLGL
jgi:AcrR family transcriptional regulator